MGTFEEIVKQNERRCHYHILKLQAHDPQQSVYCKGFHVMRHAYKVYQPDKGVLSIYFNIIIHDWMTRLLREGYYNVEIERGMNEFYLEYLLRDGAAGTSGER